VPPKKKNHHWGPDASTIGAKAHPAGTKKRNDDPNAAAIGGNRLPATRKKRKPRYT